MKNVIIYYYTFVEETNSDIDGYNLQQYEYL